MNNQSSSNDDEGRNGVQQTSPELRRRPNILITGTPGVGKTTTASMLVEALLEEEEESSTNNDDDDRSESSAAAWMHVNIGERIKDQKLYDGYDDTLQTHILDEDKLLDHLEDVLTETTTSNTGVITDYHACEIFPERWFDLVVVLRTSTDVLYDRLTTQRQYGGAKLEQNMQCEIMNAIVDEAKTSYDTNIVVELQSNTIANIQSNVQRIQSWCNTWITNNKNVS